MQIVITLYIMNISNKKSLMIIVHLISKNERSRDK